MLNYHTDINVSALLLFFQAKNYYYISKKPLTKYIFWDSEAYEIYIYIKYRL